MEKTIKTIKCGQRGNYRVSRVLLDDGTTTDVVRCGFFSVSAAGFENGLALTDHRDVEHVPNPINAKLIGEALEQLDKQ